MHDAIIPVKEYMLETFSAYQSISIHVNIFIIQTKPAQMIHWWFQLEMLE
jgi:hypothetical protein